MNLEVLPQNLIMMIEPLFAKTIRLCIGWSDVAITAAIIKLVNSTSNGRLKPIDAVLSDCQSCHRRITGNESVIYHRVDRGHENPTRDVGKFVEQFLSHIRSILRMDGKQIADVVQNVDFQVLNLHETCPLCIRDLVRLMGGLQSP